MKTGCKGLTQISHVWVGGVGSVGGKISSLSSHSSHTPIPLYPYTLSKTAICFLDLVTIGENAGIVGGLYLVQSQ